MERIKQKKIKLLQQYFITNVFSVFITWVIYAIIAVVIYLCCQPNTDNILSRAKDLYMPALFFFQPEPVEKKIFLLGLILIPMGLFIFLWLFKKFFRGKQNPAWVKYYLYTLIISCIVFLSLVFLDMHAKDLYGHSRNFQFYFRRSIIYNHFYLYSFLLYPLLLASLFWVLRREVPTFWENIIKKFVSPLIFVFMLLLMSVIFLFNIFSLKAIDENGIYIYHFNAVVYSVSQIFSSHALSEGFSNTYGLYPYFLLPVFKFIKLNTLTFSMVMSSLLVLSFILLYLTLQRLIKNRLILLLGFTAFLFIGYIYGKLETADFFFQYHPLRVIFPAIITFIAINYAQHQRKIYYFLGHIACGCAFLWNFDSGVVSSFSWLFFLIYLKPQLRQKRESITIQLRLLFTEVFNFLIIVSLVFAIFFFFIYLRYKTFPQIGNLLMVTNMFFNYGYFMLKMPLWHPWNLLALTYSIGLGISIWSWLNKKNAARGAVILFISLLGIGSLGYYQGRSHNWNLVAVAFPFFALLTLFADILYAQLTKYGFKVYHQVVLFSLSVYILSFSSFDLILNFKNITQLATKHHNLNAVMGLNQVQKNVEFIKKHVQPGEEILILSGNQGVYFIETNTSSVFQPGLTDLFLRRDYQRLLYLLKEKKNLKVFMDPTINYYHQFGIDAQLIKTITQFFHLMDSNGYMLYFEDK